MNRPRPRRNGDLVREALLLSADSLTQIADARRWLAERGRKVSPQALRKARAKMQP